LKQVVIIGLCIFAFILLLIAFPAIAGLAQGFHAGNYYQLISGIIAGSITIFALLWQFTNEREKVRNEDRVKARGFFEINYLMKADDKIKPYVCMQNIPENKHWYDYPFIFLKLYSHEVVTNCRVSIFINNDKENSLEFLLGIVFPEQLFGIPLIIDSNEIDISISYDTKMKESILHSLSFKNGITKASVKNGERIVVTHDSREVACIESDSVLFEYVGK